MLPGFVAMVSILHRDGFAARSARRLEERVLHPGDRGELPSEQVPVELLDLLRLLHVELYVHDASGFRSLCHFEFLPEGTRDGRGGYLRLPSGGERKRSGHSPPACSSIRSRTISAIVGPELEGVVRV